MKSNLKVITLIIARSTSSSSSAPSPSKKPWREAATLMLVAPPPQQKLKNKSTIKYNRDKSLLNFLLMTRSEDSPFMGRAVCFPGGKLSNVDESKEWINLFRKSDGTMLNTLRFLNSNASHPAIYIPSPSDYFSREITFRITAIRETFEESGILLCKPFISSRNHIINLTLDDTKYWQQEIQKDSNNFLTFCGKYNCVPDLWSLVEWSNWHSPKIYGPHRFDTIFYMTLLSRIPDTIMDPYEVSHMQWITARDVLHDFQAEKPLWWLPVPQFYEMFRLRNINTFKEIRKLLQLRLQFGIEKWIPIYHKAIDGAFEVLPGDDLYPKPGNINLVDYSEFNQHKYSLEELRNQVQLLHRIEFNSVEYSTYVVRNIPNRFGHIYDLKT